jgi:hypothetical protein
MASREFAVSVVARFRDQTASPLKRIQDRLRVVGRQGKKDFSRCLGRQPIVVAYLCSASTSVRPHLGEPLQGRL